jgi:hypothetical protein
MRWNHSSFIASSVPLATTAVHDRLRHGSCPDR